MLREAQAYPVSRSGRINCVSLDFGRLPERVRIVYLSLDFAYWMN